MLVNAINLDTINLITKSNEIARRTLDALCSNGRFPHAVMFEGEKGTLTDSFTIYTAMKTLCLSDDKPCGVCKNCHKILTNSHPDVMTFGNDLEKSYTVDETRFIRSKAFVLPNEAIKNFFILKNADSIPEKSQNILLKIIEEPPEHSIFLLECENSSKMLETILSRVTVIKIKNPNLTDCVEIIKSANSQFNVQDITEALKLTSNSIYSSLNILNGEETGFKFAKSLFDNICNGNNVEVLKILQTICKSKQTNIVLAELKNLLIIGIANYIKENYSGFKLTPLQTLKIIDIIDEVKFMSEQNVNTSLLPVYISSQINLALSSTKNK